MCFVEKNMGNKETLIKKKSLITFYIQAFLTVLLRLRNLRTARFTLYCSLIERFFHLSRLGNTNNSYYIILLRVPILYIIS